MKDAHKYETGRGERGVRGAGGKAGCLDEKAVGRLVPGAISLIL